MRHHRTLRCRILGRLRLLPVMAGLAAAAPPPSPLITLEPGNDDAMRPFLTTPAAAQDTEPMIAALRSRVKYLFVVYQENRSFDSYFGSFPGAHGLYSQPPEATPGFEQPIMNIDGSMGTIRPFRIGPAEHAADIDNVDHSHPAMIAKMHITDGAPRMDRYALVEEMRHAAKDAPPSLKARQFGELTMAYVDCDTIPFLWRYASRFVLFDNFFQHTVGPSTPNAIAMIAGQTGETQWLKHPSSAVAAGQRPNHETGVPVIGDLPPFWGSTEDATSLTPRNPHYKVDSQINQTYATLPLTFSGNLLGELAAADRDPGRDLADIAADIPAITGDGRAPLSWGWFQEGYDREPTDPPDAPAEGTHQSYAWHHNAPQYFGYIANNPRMAANLHGLDDFFRAVRDRALPEAGGVFYVRGGFHDIAGLRPAIDDKAVQKRFMGDDDHPGYSDSELSEALVARAVNAVARSPYWAESAIIVTYDESEGEYDHVPPTIVAQDPAVQPLSRGPRIPLLLISPFARAHVVSHEAGDHASVIRLIDTLFRLPPLALLPEESAARAAGERDLGQPFLGPADAGVPGVGDLLSGFEPSRLDGSRPPLPADYAEIPDELVNTLPHYGGQGCKALGITPEDVARGIANPKPADFDPRPANGPPSL